MVGFRAVRTILAAMVAAGLATPVISGAPAAVAATAPPPDVSVAYQVNSMHDGHLASGVEVPPLVKAWTRDLGGGVSYPVIVDGRVFVTARSGGGRGTMLYALDATTGKNVWGPVDLGGTYSWSALTYGEGRVFGVNDDGVMQAFDARTGRRAWAVNLPGQRLFSSAPTYRNGVVFTAGAGSAGTVYAVSALDGRVLWTQGVMNGDESSPAVSDTGVYVSYACVQAYDFDPASGATVWHHSGGCEGGGGRTPVLSGGRLWARDWATGSLVLNASTGALAGTFSAGPAPAFDGQAGFFLNGGRLVARDVSSQSELWSFEGDGRLSTAPLVLNGYVYVGSTGGQVWALDEASGVPVWSDDVGAGVVAPDEQNLSAPLTGLGAGQGLLVVPATNLLVAYAAASGPRPPGVAVARSWGLNAFAQLGDGTVVDRHLPVRVSGAASPADLSAGALHDLSLRSDGTVQAWGWNAYGQLGDGTTLDRRSPVTVSGLTHVTQVSAGALHSLALRDDGTVWSWGDDTYGELGDGAAAGRRTPGQVPGLTGVVAVAAGYLHSLALRADGSVWAWGWNGVGQLGDGTTSDRHAPVRVAGLGPATSISAGAGHSVAVRDDGTAWAWGWNAIGQLGDGTTIDRRSPVRVTGLSRVYRVSAGYFHNLALREDGSVSAWGWNPFGQLGDGTTIDRHTPTPVSFPAAVVSVAAGGLHSLSVDETGAVRAWGWNGFGQLGDGTVTDRARPTGVAGAPGAGTASAGAYHSLSF